MSNKEEMKLVPKLRFPEFDGHGAWGFKTLKEIAIPVEDRVGGKKLIPVSISAGIGFVPQAEKFGRDISGNQYKLYTHVRDGDFVFNKGNSLKFPQGCVYDLQGWGEVAAPNVFICFRLKEEYLNSFFRHCFEMNLHGKQLKKTITSGARSNGLLNISKETFYNINLPAPQLAEQQKIADCLSSLDELVAAECAKLKALKAHKKGLMQQLFPAEGETVPALRFAGFKGKWEEKKLGDYYNNLSTGMTPSRAKPEYYSGDIPWITSGELNYKTIYTTNEYVTPDAVKNTGLKLYPPGTLFIAITGLEAPGTRGKCAINGIPAVTNQSCMAFEQRSLVDTLFLYYWYNRFSYYLYTRFAQGSKQQSFNNEIVSKFAFIHPCLLEQKKIASCLSSLDGLITAQAEKIDTLKLHKKALMQQLFPTPTAE